MNLESKILAFAIIFLAVACGGGRDVSRTENGAVFDISGPILESRRDTSVFLGKVRAGEIIQYDAWLRNTDEVPFVITAVDTSCGCTSVEYEKRPIKPGDKGRFSFRFDSRGQWEGMHTKHIEIHTSAGKNRYTIHVGAEVEQPGEF